MSQSGPASGASHIAGILNCVTKKESQSLVNLACQFQLPVAKGGKLLMKSCYYRSVVNKSQILIVVGNIGQISTIFVNIGRILTFIVKIGQNKIQNSKLSYWT